MSIMRYQSRQFLQHCMYCMKHAPFATLSVSAQASSPCYLTDSHGHSPAGCEMHSDELDRINQTFWKRNCIIDKTDLTFQNSFQNQIKNATLIFSGFSHSSLDLIFKWQEINEIM